MLKIDVQIARLQPEVLLLRPLLAEANRKQLLVESLVGAEKESQPPLNSDSKFPNRG